MSAATAPIVPVTALLGVAPQEAQVLIAGIASALRADGDLPPTERAVLDALGRFVIGAAVPPADATPVTPQQLADALDDDRLRLGAVHAMIALETITQPVDAAVAASVERYAAAMHIDDGMLVVARDYSRRAMDLARQDLIRNSYPSSYAAAHAGTLTLHETVAPTSPIDAPIDPGLAATWRQLEHCAIGTLGRTVWDFYQHRGFAIPGTPGAVPPLLAQHDFVHCVADYGTSALGEIEVFAFIATAVPDAKALFYLILLIGLFETGAVPFVPGIATARPGHLSTAGGPVRFADAVRRGLLVHTDVIGGVDWFEYADTPIDDVRARFGVPDKDRQAIDAGSLSATDPRAVFGAD